MADISETLKDRLAKKALTDISLIAKQHNIDILTAPKYMLDLAVAIYQAGAVMGMEESKKIVNESWKETEKDVTSNRQ